MDAPFNIPFDTQLAFLWNELTGKENRTLRGLRRNNQLLPRDYARMFEELYERADGKGMEARMNNAAAVYSGMQSEVPDLPQNAIRAYRFLTDKGLSGQQAAGIVGNLMAESYNEIRPNAYNPEGGGQGAYGIAQWRGPRLDALNAFAEANKPRDAGPPLEAKMNGNKPMSLLRMPQNLRDKLSNPLQRDPATGLNPLQSLAAGMDALVLRGYGQGQAIREQGLRRAEADRQNLTAEWFAKQPNGELYAEMLKMGVPVGQVYAAYQKAQTGDYVVVGDALVDRKTGQVIYQGKGAGQSQGQIRLSDGTVITLGKLDQGQGNAMDFGGRMSLANDVINSTEEAGLSLGNAFLSKIPVFGNAVVSPEFQRYDNARQIFINSVLRRESGAAIAASEFEGANKQYFPQPFDSPDVVKQKAAARQIAIDMILAASGPNASQYAKDRADELSRQLNPLFGTSEYEAERERLEEEKKKKTSAGGNVVIE